MGCCRFDLLASLTRLATSIFHLESDMASDHAVRSTFRLWACAAAAAATLGAAMPAQALVFNLTTTGNASADLGFQRAANFWQGVFADPVAFAYSVARLQLLL